MMADHVRKCKSIHGTNKLETTRTGTVINHEQDRTQLDADVDLAGCRRASRGTLASARQLHRHGHREGERQDHDDGDGCHSASADVPFLRRSGRRRSSRRDPLFGLRRWEALHGERSGAVDDGGLREVVHDAGGVAHASALLRGWGRHGWRSSAGGGREDGDDDEGKEHRPHLGHAALALELYKNCIPGSGTTLYIAPSVHNN